MLVRQKHPGNNFITRSSETMYYLHKYEFDISRKFGLGKPKRKRNRILLRTGSVIQTKEIRVYFPKSWSHRANRPI